MADSDLASVLSIAPSSASSRKSKKRSPNNWYVGREVNRGRKAFRNDCQHSIFSQDARALEFQINAYEEIVQDPHADSLSMPETEQTNCIRVLLLDCCTQFLDEFFVQRCKHVTRDAIIDHKLRYTRFLSVMFADSLVSVSAKWIHVLFQKEMHAFLKDTSNVSTVAAITLCLTLSHMAGDVSVSSETIYNSWCKNILKIAQIVCDSVNNKNRCPYVQIDDCPPITNHIFNVMLSQMILIDVPVEHIRYTFLFTAVMHCAVASECKEHIEIYIPALIAMSSSNFQLDLKNRDCEGQFRLVEMIASSKSEKLIAMNQELAMQRAKMLTFPKDSNVSSEFVRLLLKLCFEAAQHENGRRYKDVIRSIIKNVVLYRLNTSTGQRQNYKLNHKEAQMPTATMGSEWVNYLQKDWTEFLKKICREIDGNTNVVKEFYNHLAKLIQKANPPGPNYERKIASFFIDSDRTILKIFHNTMLCSARSRCDSFAIMSLGIPALEMGKSVEVSSNES
jgi:hypothetical protein